MYSYTDRIRAVEFPQAPAVARPRLPLRTPQFSESIPIWLPGYVARSPVAQRFWTSPSRRVA